jgi:hypothetical protein
MSTRIALSFRRGAELSRLDGQNRRSGDGLGWRRLRLRIPPGRRIPRLRISAPGNGKVVHGNLPTHSAAVGSSRGLGILKQEERPFPQSGNRGNDRRARFLEPNPSGRLPGGIQVLVEGPSGRQTIVSQKDGRFQLWGLSPGGYRVTSALPKSFLPDEQTVKLE